MAPPHDNLYRQAQAENSFAEMVKTEDGQSSQGIDEGGNGATAWFVEASALIVFADHSDGWDPPSK